MSIGHALLPFYCLFWMRFRMHSGMEFELQIQDTVIKIWTFYPSSWDAIWWWWYWTLQRNFTSNYFIHAYFRRVRSSWRNYTIVGFLVTLHYNCSTQESCIIVISIWTSGCSWMCREGTSCNSWDTQTTYNTGCFFSSHSVAGATLLLGPQTNITMIMF
jgi:hypothetical protein